MQINFSLQSLRAAAEFAGSFFEGPGAIAEGIVGTVTGNDFLGDVAGVITNIATGNIPGAVSQGVEALLSGVDLLDDMGLLAPPGQQGAEGSYCTLGYATDPGVEGGGGYQERPSKGIGRGRGGGARRTPVKERPPARGRPAKGCGPAGDDFGRILNDPSLSLEEKIAMLFAAILDKLDGEIEGALKDVAKSESGGGGESASTQQQKLQLLMQRRERMNGLATNLNKMMSEMSMRIISNFR